MTVKKISQTDQDYLVALFQRGATIDSLAVQYSVSRRTVIRALEDHQVDPGIRRRKAKTAALMYEQLPIDCKVTVSDRGFVIEGVQLAEGQVELFKAKSSWLKRAINKVSQVFARA